MQALSPLPSLSPLIEAGRALLATIVAALTGRAPTPLPRRLARDPAAAQTRIARTLAWIEALARTLAGDATWLIVPSYRFPAWPYRFPPFTAKLREECGLPPIPPRTEAQKAAAHLWYVKKVFATQATGIIAARLARRLGLTPADSAWPHDLIPLTQTPAALARAKPPRPAPPPLQTEAAPAQAEDPVPAFHKRE